MTTRRATAANTGFFFAGALVAALVVQEFNGPVGHVAAASNSTIDHAVSYSPRTNQGAAYLGNVSLHEKQTQQVWKETKSQQSWVF